MSQNPRSSTPAGNPKGDKSQQGSNWLDRIGVLWIRFRRFTWDVVGIGLLALALITFVALLGLTQGIVITPWAESLKKWLGWGGIFIPVLMGMMGYWLLRRQFRELRIFPLGRTLAIEGWIFSILALLDVISGHFLERAILGLDGGLIGWGLVELFSLVLSLALASILIVALFLVFTYYVIGLDRIIGKRVWQWVESETGQNEQSTRASNRGSLQGKSEINLPVLSDLEEKRGQIRPRSEGLPPLNLLLQVQTVNPDEEQVQEMATIIEKTLGEFGVPARVVGFRIGPTVTQYAVEPGYVEKETPEGEMVRQKVRVAQISGLARDLAMALSAERLRIEAPVPGQTFVGIEVPNAHSSAVRLRPILESEAFQKLSSPLALALGQDVSGKPVVADLVRMPHLLIAGTTGSGKSVCISAITACLVMNNSPDDLRLAMLDPKMVELVRFNGLPHLLNNVETQIDRMLGVLRWALQEMDQRYRLLEAANAKDLESYNRKQERRKQATLPRIVILIDELADLIISAPDQTEHSLVRLAQMARATGIHLVLATQRPSTDVVTGLIKANFPARISFTVASSVDSRVILDTNGAETLLGRGDMLFLNPEVGTPVRSQGAMITDPEIERIITFWQKMIPEEAKPPAPWEEFLNSANEVEDDLMEAAIKVIRDTGHASTSLIQRKLRIGYPRAARIMDELEALGVVGPSQGGGKDREVLMSPEEDEEDGYDEGRE
jgi:S-DNA-T family DNA segregation ATPase FtsK/SpoIIIE